LVWTLWHTVAVALLVAALVLYTQLRVNLGGYMAARMARGNPARTSTGLRAIARSLWVPSLAGWPRMVDKHLVRAQLLVQAARADEALAVCERIAPRARDPARRIELLLTMADSYDALWRVDEAASAVEQALDVMRDSGRGGPPVLFAQAQLASLRGDAREAALLAGRAAAQTAAALAQANPRVAEATAVTSRLMELTALGKYDEAVALADRIATGVTGGAFASTLAAAAATAYIQAGKPDRAREVVARVDGDASRARLMLGVQMAEGDYEAALHTAGSIAADLANDAASMETAVLPLICLGRFEEAVDRLRGVLKRGEGRGGTRVRNERAVLLCTAAEACLESGRAEEAEAFVREVFGMPAVSGPVRARAQANMARALRTLGDQDAAREMLAEADAATRALIIRGNRPAATLLALAQAGVELGAMETALRVLDDADRFIAAAGQRTLGAFLRGEAFSGLGRAKRARAAYARAAAGPNAHFAAVRARERLAELDGAGVGHESTGGGGT